MIANCAMKPSRCWRVRACRISRASGSTAMRDWKRATGNGCRSCATTTPDASWAGRSTRRRCAHSWQADPAARSSSLQNQVSVHGYAVADHRRIGPLPRTYAEIEPLHLRGHVQRRGGAVRLERHCPCDRLADAPQREPAIGADLAVRGLVERDGDEMRLGKFRGIEKIRAQRGVVALAVLRVETRDVDRDVELRVREIVRIVIDRRVEAPELAAVFDALVSIGERERTVRGIDLPTLRHRR